MPPKKKSDKKKSAATPKRVAKPLPEGYFHQIVRGPTGAPRKSGRLSVRNIKKRVSEDPSMIYDNGTKLAGPRRLVEQYLINQKEGKTVSADVWDSHNMDLAVRTFERKHPQRKGRTSHPETHDMLTNLILFYNEWKGTTKVKETKPRPTLRERMNALPSDKILNITKLHENSSGDVVGAVVANKPKDASRSGLVAMKKFPKVWYKAKEPEATETRLTPREVTSLFEKAIDWTRVLPETNISQNASRRESRSASPVRQAPVRRTTRRVSTPPRSERSASPASHGRRSPSPSRRHSPVPARTRSPAQTRRHSPVRAGARSPFSPTGDDDDDDDEDQVSADQLLDRVGRR